MDSIKQWITDKLQQLLDWFYDLILWIPRKLFAATLDELATYLESIAPPEFMTQAKQLLAQWGPQLGWFFDIIEFNWGMSLVVSAYTMRYVWSWLPFVGKRS
ncbi:hypothetical protein D9M68_486370 [compost metagenome]